MRPRDYVVLQISHDPLTDFTPTWTDYTDGMLDVSIIRGIQSPYTAAWQQIESGVLTFTSRNTNLDPHVNDQIRMNRRIRILSNNEPIFTGRITDINVDYQPKGKPPIITLVAVDMIGTMALHTLRDSFKNRLGSTMDLYGMMQELEITNSGNPAVTSNLWEIIGFSNPHRELTADSSTATTAPTGTTALQMATKLAQGGLAFFYADRNNDVYQYSNINEKRNDPNKIDFISAGGGTSYRAVELTDGFDLLKNQLSVQTRVTTIPLYVNNFSVREWGPQKGSVDTFLGNSTQDTYMNSYANLVFQQSSIPLKDILTITFDATNTPDAVETIDILDNVFIDHEVDPENITRDYAIIGIQHRITESTWETTYNLKNMFIYETVFPTPIVTSDHPLGGTINDDITYSISNISEIDMTSGTYTWKYAAGTVPIGLVGTTFSTSATPTVNYTLAEVGNKYVTCTVTNDYGFTKTSDAFLQTVAGAAPTNVNFTYTINANNTAALTVVGSATEASTYSWNFGDGTVVGPFTVNTYTHTYTTSGTKTVTLTANNAFGSTASTPQNISITVPVNPPTPPDQFGTWGVRYLKFARPIGTAATGPSWNGMRNLACTTSGSLTNRASAANVVWGIPYETVGQAWGEHNWYRATGTTQPANIPQSGAASDSAIRTATGIYPRNYLTGTANWSIIVDLGVPYYDIKTINLGLYVVGAPVNIPNLNVYATTHTGTAAGAVSASWTLIGTLSKDTGVFTPNQTMPLNLP